MMPTCLRQEAPEHRGGGAGPRCGLGGGVGIPGPQPEPTVINGISGCLRVLLLSPSAGETFSSILNLNVV